MTMMRRGIKAAAILSVAIAALLWSGFVLRFGLGSTALDLTVLRLTDGQTFTSKELEGLLQNVEQAGYPEHCSPKRLRSVAIARLAIFEESVARNALTLATWKDAHSAVGRALACTPSDGFLWLAQFRLEAATSELSGLHLDYLLMSYQLAPHEAWVMQRRLSLAAFYWGRLPEEVRAHVRQDFTTLVKHARFHVAFQFLDHVDHALQEDLLGAVGSLGSSQIDRFALALQSRNRLYPLVSWFAERYCPTKSGRRDPRCAPR